MLGVTLFARNTRRVEITDVGREFVAVAERVRCRAGACR
jgi:DNA-binding transcriptional LysR family regulator